MLAPADLLRRLPLRWQAALVVLALGARLTAWLALSSGEAPTLSRGYSYYVEMADNLAEGRGFVRTMPFGQGDRFAIRTPGYPLVLVALDALPLSRAASVPLVGICCGVVTMLLAASLAARMFGQRSGLVAGLVLSLYPLTVVHDSALQETALATCLLVAAALVVHGLMTQERRPDHDRWRAALLGALAAAVVLVRVALLPSVIALALCLLVGARKGRDRVVLASIALVVLQIGLLPWRLRNAHVVGRPVLTSDTGRSLWLGNNPETFSIYPRQSIDRAEERAWIALPEATRASVRALGSDELAQDAWFRARAMDHVRADPAGAVAGGLRKAWATFSPWFNPAGSLAKQWAHLLSYAPVAALAMIALVRLRSRWRETLPFVALVALLALQSAVFFGHSGYRAYLDPLLIVLASAWFAAAADRDVEARAA